MKLPPRLIQIPKKLPPKPLIPPLTLECLRLNRLVIRETKEFEAAAAGELLQFGEENGGFAGNGDHTVGGDVELCVWGWGGGVAHEDAAGAACVGGEFDVDGFYEGGAEVGEGEEGDGAYEAVWWGC